MNKDADVTRFYDYEWDDEESRLEDIDQTTYPRRELSEALTAYQIKHGGSPQSLDHARALAHEQAAVVVGGQQAGLLTGPAYTIHKAVSIILEAERLQQKWDRPFIPMFWIAGEDHDVDEINNTFVHHRQELAREKIFGRNDKRTPASERYIKQSEADAAIDALLAHINETQWTARLREELRSMTEEPLTYSSWCAKVMLYLFADSGLVVMDAHHPDVRKLEQETFLTMLDRSSAIQESVQQAAAEFEKGGYENPVNLDKENMHLFIHHQDERFLLYNEGNTIKEKNGSRSWDYEAFFTQAQKGDFQFSNNVITRPVMQDILLPVHTFIAGAGELKYWGLLQGAFHAMNHHMPLVRPRDSFTWISRKTKKTMMDYQLTPEQAADETTAHLQEQLKQQWKAADESAAAEKAERLMREALKPLSEVLQDDRQLHDTYNKKAAALIDAYRQDVTKAVDARVHVDTVRLESLETELRPGNAKQERVLNILPFLNVYGPDLIEGLLRRLRDKDTNTPRDWFIYL